MRRMLHILSCFEGNLGYRDGLTQCKDIQAKALTLRKSPAPFS